MRHCYAPGVWLDQPGGPYPLCVYYAERREIWGVVPIARLRLERSSSSRSFALVELMGPRAVIL